MPKAEGTQNAAISRRNFERVGMSRITGSLTIELLIATADVDHILCKADFLQIQAGLIPLQQYVGKSSGRHFHECVGGPLPRLCYSTQIRVSSLINIPEHAALLVRARVPHSVLCCGVTHAPCQQPSVSNPRSERLRDARSGPVLATDRPT